MRLDIHFHCNAILNIISSFVCREETEEHSSQSREETCVADLAGCENDFSSKDAKNSQDGPGRCGGFDVPIAERLKRRQQKRKDPPSKEDVSTLDDSTTRMTLRKREASVLDGEFSENNATKTADEKCFTGIWENISTGKFVSAISSHVKFLSLLCYSAPKFHHDYDKCRRSEFIIKGQRDTWEHSTLVNRRHWSMRLHGESSQQRRELYQQRDGLS